MRTEIKTRKTVPLSGGAEAHINLLNGESVITSPDLNDSAMGVGISHILHLSGQEENAFCCGENMRLNLHEKFVKTNGEDEDVDYVYTDCITALR